MRARIAAMLVLAAAGCEQVTPTAPTPTPPPAWTPREKTPEELFLTLGCPTCHAKGAPYEGKLAGARGKPLEEVAAWIRNPQEKRPGTPMPTFASRVTEKQALALAAWLQENGYRF